MVGQKFIWVVQARIWVGHGLPGLIAGTRDLLDPGPRDHESSQVTWATSVSILVFLGLSVLDLGPM